MFSQDFEVGRKLKIAARGGGKKVFGKQPEIVADPDHPLGTLGGLGDWFCAVAKNGCHGVQQR